jgi:sugar (pentulose or hexulose) kinase
MSKMVTGIPVIAIFDIGKTNKKFLLFNKNYEVVFETSIHLNEIEDEDNEPCEDLVALTDWIKSTLKAAIENPEFKIEALNFSTYGASFVHIDGAGKPATPLYNYLKKFPESLSEKFYSTYGGKDKVARETASPVLGNLNSGLQIYLLKYFKPEIFEKLKVSLHLPQFVSSLFTGHFFSDITSVGCHTHLWNFDDQAYHKWVYDEGLDKLLPPIVPSYSVLEVLIHDTVMKCGIGLHDSSAALIPYLKKFKEPFMLLSTGTWCISLNPFNHSPLTAEELTQDCLSYLSYESKPVKASRLFSGYEHEQQIKKLASHFNKDENYFTTILYNENIVLSEGLTNNENLSSFSSYEEAYHALINSLVNKQFTSSMLVLQNQPVERIFVDGGFSKNDVFMNVLATKFPNLQVYSTAIAQASALGAAMAIHWQPESSLTQFPIKRYESKRK